MVCRLRLSQLQVSAAHHMVLLVGESECGSVWEITILDGIFICCVDRFPGEAGYRCKHGNIRPGRGRVDPSDGKGKWSSRPISGRDAPWGNRCSCCHTAGTHDRRHVES